MNTAAQPVLPILPCACANLRRATRIITRLYNQELRAEGIETTQYTLLMTLDLAGEVSQRKLGEILAMDSTTLTRMLELSRKRGWVQAKEGNDRRVKILGLTKAGKEKLQRTSRSWKRAQARLRAALGEETMDQVGGLMAKVTRIPV